MGYGPRYGRIAVFRPDLGKTSRPRGVRRGLRLSSGGPLGDSRCRRSGIRLRLPARGADAQHTPRRQGPDPAASQIGSPNESELLPQTVRELDLVGLRPREVAVDGGFPVDAINQAFPD